MLIAWTKETEDRYTATWQGSALLLKYVNRSWRVIVTHLADGHVCCPPNCWVNLDAAKQDIDVKALRALMTAAKPVARQRSLPKRVIYDDGVAPSLSRRNGLRAPKKLKEARKP